MYTGSPLAPPGRRLAASLLDMFILLFAVGAVFVPLGIAMLLNQDPTTTVPLTDIIAWGMLAVLAGGVGFFVTLLQFILLGRTGQTLGKMIMGIKIVHAETGENAGFVQNVLVRTIANGLISMIPGYGLIDVLLIFRTDHRCAHDFLAGTIVVQAQPDDGAHAGITAILLVAVPAFLSAGWIQYVKMNTPVEPMPSPVQEEVQQSSADLNAQVQAINMRNAKRRADINVLSAAVKLYIEEHPGQTLGNIALRPYEICRTGASNCDGLVDLNVLVGGYVTALPVDPTEDDPRSTGYTITKDAQGVYSVSAPNAEDEIIFIKQD